MSTPWDVNGKTILITGATNGIGLEASVELARRGARVVMVGRNVDKTAAAVADVKRRSGSPTVESLPCDFSSQKSIRALADAYRARYERLDVLVNNAGGVFDTRTVTVDGLEATFATNHLGYVLLTRLLQDLLERSAPARVVIVASVGHRRGTMDFADLGYEKGYWIMKAYCRSKLGNVLFANELARRFLEKNVDITVNSLHPGAVATGIWAGAPAWTKPLLTLFARPFFISAEKGGSRIVHLAASPEVTGVTGKYFESNKSVWPSRLAQDTALAARLWDVSATLVGLPTSP